jgi:hypothetical protein
MQRFLPESWWRVSAPIAIVTLIFNNLVPLLGVLYLGWSLYAVIYIYWLENGVVGLFNVVKMLLARGDEFDNEKGRKFVELIGPQNKVIARVVARVVYIPFFIFHYGLFWLVHGLFVVNLVGPFLGSIPSGNLLFAPSTEGVWGAVGAMVISHGSSFVRNYIGHGEYLQATPQQLTSQPYSRVFVLHLTILGGAFLVANLGEPLYGLVLLVVLKTGVDLWAHLREHRRYQDVPLPTAALSNG